MVRAYRSFCSIKAVLTVESDYAIAIATLGDWLKNFAPVFQQM